MNKNFFLFSKEIFLRMFLGSLFLIVGFFVFVNDASAATRYVDPANGLDAAGCNVENATCGIGGNACASIEYAAENTASWQFGDEILLCPSIYNTGSGIWKSGTNHTINPVPSGGSGYFTIKAATENVTIDIPTDTVAQLWGLRGRNRFQKVNVTNNAATVARWSNVSNTSSDFEIVMEDGMVDYPGSVIGTYFIEFLNAPGYNASAIFRRMKLKDWVHMTANNTGFVRNNIAVNGEYTSTITIEGCLIKNFGSLFYSSTARVPIHLNMFNNTIVEGVDRFLFNDAVVDSRSVVNITGNIFKADNVFSTPLYFGNLSPDCSSGRCGPPANWLVKGNVLYKSGEYPDINLSRIVDNSAYGSFSDETNYFIDPNFTDPGNDDYTPQNGLIANKGYSPNLPDVDINGNEWKSVSDVGAFRNPSATSPTELGSNTLIVIGDSIAAGASYRFIQDQSFGWLSGWTIYGAGSSCNQTAGENCSSWGGSLGETGKWLIDRAVGRWGVPSHIVILTYANSLSPRGNNPINLTTTQAADDVLTMAKKIQSWGATPVILGMMPSWHSTQSGQLTTAQDFNSKLANICGLNGYICEFPINRMAFNPNYANAYNDLLPGYYTTETLVSNVHPSDPEGRRLINSTLEDVLQGRNAYYVTQGGESIVGSAHAPATYRYPISMFDFNNLSELYGGQSGRPIVFSGEYDLTIAPINLNTPNQSQKMTIDISNWRTGEDFLKEWTEASDILGNTDTLHTVGDLTPNKYYNVSVDDVLGNNIEGENCINGICKANSEGKIIFTYTGTYSEHTFKVEEGDNSNPTLTNNTQNKFATNTTAVNLSLTTDENSICKYSNNQNATFDNATAFTTTGETTHATELNNLISGSYTYYALCRDSNANESSYTITFEIAPEELKQNVSAPIIKIQKEKTKMKSGKTIYSDEKEIKLQGEDIKLKNGTIKIYRNSKLIETIIVDGQGKWSKKIKLDKDFNGYLKVKQFDEFGTLIGEKKTRVKVDTKKPEFVSFPKDMALLKGGDKINFKATDNKKIESYKIYFDGKIYKTKNDSFAIPNNYHKGIQYLGIKAYDKAGNSVLRKILVVVR